MNTTLAESETRAGCAGTYSRTDMEEAAKRVEKSLNDFSEKLEDGRIAAERLLKRSRYAVEDRLEDTARQIKRNPLGSLAIAFAAGAAFAFLAPHLGKNSRKANPSE